MSERSAVVYRGKGNLYLNITNRCACACVFCLREFTSEVFGVSLLLSREPTVDEIVEALRLELSVCAPNEIVFCGLGEPTLRLAELLATGRWISRQAIPWRLNTSGLGQLANPDVDVVAALVDAGIGGISVSLNAADDDSYNRLCRPACGNAFAAVLDFARSCVAAGVPTVLTAVEHPSSDLQACRALAEAMDISFRTRSLIRPGDA